MKKLELSDQNARKLYKDMPDFRASLEDTFGKAFFSGKITDRIKSYEDACVELGIDPIDEKQLKNLGFTNTEIARRKLETITSALNEDWQADLYNTSQYKYYGWFDVSSGSFRFCGTDFQYSIATAGVGSRLCFSSRELAEYAAKQFTEYYKIIAEN